MKVKKLPAKVGLGASSAPMFNVEGNNILTLREAGSLIMQIMHAGENGPAAVEGLRTLAALAASRNVTISNYTFTA